MKKLSYLDYEEGIIKFSSKEDEEICLKHWKDENKLSVDEFGRVYNEGGQYIADVGFISEDEE
ncbi:MAG: hypothetical protein Q4A58_02495 [Fusobacterium sp.]|uniref:hypothetical protein n=1 Tax=Fusobacterium sp. TaxID=68766 RepID=UPI0026DB2277|nr:hypothetical protein [Fusobacterium sp.]MDO4690147.1 hypothetical protein [Fusobacterium sp.]